MGANIDPPVLIIVGVSVIPGVGVPVGPVGMTVNVAVGVIGEGVAEGGTTTVGVASSDEKILHEVTHNTIKRKHKAVFERVCISKDAPVISGM
jgi:hypothetical protein